MREPDSSLRMILVSIQGGGAALTQFGIKVRQTLVCRRNFDKLKLVAHQLAEVARASRPRVTRVIRGPPPNQAAPGALEQYPSPWQPRNLVFAVCKDGLLSPCFDAL